MDWVKQARDGTERAADPDALTESEREELRRLRRQVIELETDTEIVRRAAAFRPGDDEVIRFRFVQDNMTEMPVKRMCELAEVLRSSF